MKVAGRFILALVLIVVSGSLSNAHIVGSLPALLGLGALGVLVWAVVGAATAWRGRARQR